MKPRSILHAFATVLALALTASADPVSMVEYFDYGPTAGDLRGKGTAGNGWSGAWDPTSSRTLAADYGTANLTITHTGYLNAGNTTATGSGTAAGTDNRVSGVDRHFSAGLAGTVWISFLARFTGTSTQDALFGFEDSGLNGTDQCVGILGTAGIVRWNTGTTGQYIQSGLTLNTVYLFLAKVEVDYSGTFDRITTWVNPNLAALGAGTVKDGIDVLGTALNSIFLFNSSGNIDAIRISNDPEGFKFVTTGAIPPKGTVVSIW